MKLILIHGKLYRIMPENITPEVKELAFIWNVGDPIDLTFENNYHLVDREGPYESEFPFRLKLEYRSLPVYAEVNDWRMA